MVAMAVYTAHKVFGSRLPEPVTPLLNAVPNYETKTSSIINRRLSDAPKNDNAIEEAMMEWRNAGLQGGMKARLAILLSHLSPGPDDWNWVSIHSWASALYYIVRPIRIIAALGKSVLNPSRQ